MPTPDPWYLEALRFLDAHKDSLALLVALAATILGPLVSVRIAKKQITAALATAKQQTETAMTVARLNFNASVVSANRQKWIDNLRDALAELVALLFAIGSHQGHPDEDHLTRMRRMIELSQKVELFLNPDEPEHGQFVSLLHKLRVKATMRPLPMADDMADDPDGLASMTVDLMQRAKKILKVEWERVKKGV